MGEASCGGDLRWLVGVACRSCRMVELHMYMVRESVNGLFGECGHQEWMISPKNGRVLAAIIDKSTVSYHLQPDAANTKRTHVSKR